MGQTCSIGLESIEDVVCCGRDEESHRILRGHVDTGLHQLPSLENGPVMKRDDNTGVWKSWFLSIRSSHQGRELACFESAAAYHSRGAPVGVLNLDICEIRNGVQSQKGPSGYWEFSIHDRSTGKTWECGCPAQDQRAVWIASLQRSQKSFVSTQPLRAAYGTQEDIPNRGPPIGNFPKQSTSPTPVHHGKHGHVWKRGEWNTGFRDRYFVVGSDHTCQYFESKQAFDSQQKPKGHINLVHCKVYPTSDPKAHGHGHGHSAKFVQSMQTIDDSLWRWEIQDGVSHRKFELGCKTEKEREDWIHYIHRIAHPSAHGTRPGSTHGNPQPDSRPRHL
eukprot:Tamp_21079.p1 GENE.Tamp_21079~~Tamp_21079.p1  ORF type:complete len:362 (+),score=23.85 Tamp_21079:85-1086(+)